MKETTRRFLIENFVIAPIVVLLAVAVLTMIFGCCAIKSNDGAPTEMSQRGHPVNMDIVDSQRFTVTRVSVVSDPLAYYDKRGIYLIKDAETGQEYLGVSGIGISELGSHHTGTINHRHED